MSDITYLPFLPYLTPFSLLLSFQLPHFSDNDTGECGEQQEEGLYSPSERRNVCVCLCVTFHLVAVSGFVSLSLYMCWPSYTTHVWV